MLQKIEIDDFNFHSPATSTQQEESKTIVATTITSTTTTSGEHEQDEPEIEKKQEAQIARIGNSALQQRLKNQLQQQQNLRLRLQRQQQQRSANITSNKKLSQARKASLASRTSNNSRGNPFAKLQDGENRTDVYEKALQYLANETHRRKVDPLGASSFIPATPDNRIDLYPKVDHLGVLVDAGRHFFSIEWLKRLIHYLYRLRFNMIHLRLTDDQAFNVRLESFPQLSLISAAGSHNSTYSPSDLRELVAYAKKYNISIVPEINIPGHSGGWSGIPGMIVQCPKFSCKEGYGIPLNIKYDNIKPVLKGVIGEVLDIFDHPPFLHLGGDEVEMSAKCFVELGQKQFTSEEYEVFEHLLEEILEELHYPVDQVVRWEVQPSRDEQFRAGNIVQHWFHLPGQKVPLYDNRKYFMSWRLYMDTNHLEGADKIFQNAMDSFQFHRNGTRHHPLALVPATFELNPYQWMQRNVAARLIPVAMAAAQLTFNESSQLMATHDHYCKALGIDSIVCSLSGLPAVSLEDYKLDWDEYWRQWRQHSCTRNNQTAVKTVR